VRISAVLALFVLLVIIDGPFHTSFGFCLLHFAARWLFRSLSWIELSKRALMDSMQEIYQLQHIKVDYYTFLNYKQS